ncbi:MmgE/PrpD family protein [Tateyamaria pelophila]|uniref:MmgE/PrpD family protein n=1 Tax=Tateyamaria pelophila TaxID=328415 RepID=UPI001CBB5045|nr:MmgE/PrpD family protein [Tateyamaria pelophila]
MEQRSKGITELVLTYARSEPPRDVRGIMRLSVLDWAACGIAGAQGGGFAAWASTLDAAGPATRFDGRMGSVSEAALVNGTLSHALDFDDTHFAHIGHPSVAVVPAALAMAEMASASMATMVDAALVGAETSVAVGMWLGRGHYQVGYHQTATAGAFGATVAAGRILDLSDTQMRHALSLCSTMASGLKSQFGTMGKPLNAGLAARCGVEAARWAASGMTSVWDGLSGPLGFGETHLGAGELPVFAWRMGDVSHKFHACCHGLHASLEAVRGSDLSTARRIEVFTHPRWLTVCNQPAPDTGLGAKFSYKQVMAMAALGIDTGDIAQFTDDCAMRPDVITLRDRVHVSQDDTLSEMQARVVIDGEAHFHDLRTPLAYEARQERIREKACALVGARADDLWAAIEAEDLSRFAGLLKS